MIWLLLAIILILTWIGVMIYHLLINIWTEIGKTNVILEHLHEHHFHKSQT